MLGLMPHGSCFLWNPALTFLHASTDFLIALAYGAITYYLVNFFNQHPTLWMGRKTWLVFGFIGWCGLVHAVEVWNVWHTNYWLEGYLKLITSLFSWAGVAGVVAALPLAHQLITSLAENRKYQEMLETAINYSPRPMAIAIFDRQMRYIRDYPKWRELYGLSQDIAGRSHYEVFPQLPEIWIEQHRSVLEEGQSYSEEEGSWFIRPDGKRECIVYGIAPWYLKDGAIGGMVAISATITRLKLAEEALLNYVRDLEQSNEELGQFGYTVSHDLRAPLRTVRGFLEFLYPQLFGIPDLQLNEEQKAELAQNIVSEFDRLNQMIQDLLEWSKVGREEVALHPVEIVPVLRHVLAAMAEDLRTTQAEIILDEATLGTVVAHPSQLEQLFQNLIANAIKFVAPGNKPYIRIYGEVASGFTTITIHDNGIGFDQEQFGTQIFRFRYRLHHDEYEGTGLGLAICKKIAEHLKGQIWVESKPHEGSKFKLRLRTSENV